jgi:RNA polymerase sigma-70 factor (ECF subfamily)
VNGQTGALFLDADGAVIAAMAFDIAEGRIQGINSVANPDKLRHLGAVGDAWALLEQVRSRARGR